MSKKTEKKVTVVKANDLITASYPMTVREHRLLLAAITLVDSRSTMTELNEREIVITAEYYNKIFEVSNPYRDMNDAAKRLSERWVFFENQKEYGRMRWVSEVGEAKNKGHVRLIFSEGIAPFLSELSGRFASYEIKRVAKLTSAYSFRLFEMLNQFQTTRLVRMSIESFSYRLCLPSSYKRIGDLKMKVLDPAIAELDKHSGLVVQYVFLPEDSRKKETIEFRFYDRFRAIEQKSDPAKSTSSNDPQDDTGGQVKPGSNEGRVATEGNPEVKQRTTKTDEEARAEWIKLRNMISPLEKHIISPVPRSED